MFGELTVSPSITFFSAPMSWPPASACTSASSFATVASSCSAMKLVTDQATVANSSNPDRPNIAAYRMVSRKLEVRSGLGRRTYAVSAAANRIDQFGPPAIDLAAQPADMAFHQAGARIEMKAPDILQQHGPRHHLAGMLHQIFQKLVL